MENRLVFGVDVTNPSVKSLSESGLETGGARGEVFLLNRADSRSRADWSLSFGLNRFVRNGFLVVAELSSVDGRKGLFLMRDFLLVVAAVVVLLLLLLAPLDRFLSTSC